MFEPDDMVIWHAEEGVDLCEDWVETICKWPDLEETCYKTAD